MQDTKSSSNALKSNRIHNTAAVAEMERSGVKIGLFSLKKFDLLQSLKCIELQIQLHKGFDKNFAVSLSISLTSLDFNAQIIVVMTQGD